MGCSKRSVDKSDSKMAKKFTIGISEGAIRRTGSLSRVIYRRRVFADNRVAALSKCLPEIRRKVLPKVDESIKYVSVHVGETHSVTGRASRLRPIQINVRTGRIRLRR